MNATNNNQLPGGVSYKPGTLACRRDVFWRGEYDPNGPIVQDLAKLPVWKMSGEDGSEINVCREQTELIGWAVDPLRPGRVTVYGSGEDCSGPLERHPDLDEFDRRRPATDAELAVMNRILRPLALERDWADLVDEATACDHATQHCVKTKTVGSRVLA